MNYTPFMLEALKLSSLAYNKKEVPVGALIISKDGKILARQYNKKEQQTNPCGHAEILAIQEACKKLNAWRLLDTTLVVTLEPCPMCLAAMVQARISTLVFGAYDLKGGALSLNYNLYNDRRLNHSFQVIGGIEQEKCSKILTSFFKMRRETHR